MAITRLARVLWLCFERVTSTRGVFLKEHCNYWKCFALFCVTIVVLESEISPPGNPKEKETTKKFIWTKGEYDCLESIHNIIIDLVKAKVKSVDQISVIWYVFLTVDFGWKLNALKSFSFRKKTEGNKDFPFIAKLKDFLGKPSVLCYKKSKQKENRTEGKKGPLIIKV